MCRSSTHHPQVGWSSGGGCWEAASCLSAQSPLPGSHSQSSESGRGGGSFWARPGVCLDLWRGSSRSPGGSSGFLHREPPDRPSSNQSRRLIEADGRDAEETDQGETNCCSEAFIMLPLLLPHQSLPLPRLHCYGNHQSSPSFTQASSCPSFCLPLPPPPASGGDRIVTHQ